MLIGAGPGAIGEAAAAARAFGKAAAIGADPAARLAIIVEELVANLIDHAALPPGARIDLELAIVDGAIRLTLEDPATPFDPRTELPPAAPSEMSGAGAGLAMIRAWSHIESYTSVDGRNRLILWLAPAR